MSTPGDKSKSILSQWATKKKKAVSNSKLAIVKRPSSFTASEGQQRLYFLDQLNPDLPVYNLTEVWTFEGILDVEHLRKSITLVGKRHDLLRTTFNVVDEEISCQIQETFEYKYAYNDLTQLSKEERDEKFNVIAQSVATETFDLNTGPLVNISLIAFKENLHKIVINIHHIISDKWSMRNFRTELSQFYSQLKEGKEAVLPPLKVQYYESTLNSISSTDESKTQDYWKSKLNRPIQNVSLPNDLKGKNDSSKGKYAYNSLKKTLSDDVRAYCRSQGITPFVFFLTVFKILISRYSQTEDITVGTPISTRTKPEYESLIGFFNETIVLRSQLTSDKTFEQVLADIKTTVFEAFEHKEIGFQQLLNIVNPDRKPGSQSLFQMMFLFHQKHKEPAFADGLTLSIENYDMGVSKFDFTLYIEESKENFDIIIEYATDLYSDKFTQTFHHHFETLVINALKQPSEKIGKLNFLNAEEKAKIKHLGTGISTSHVPYSNVIEAIAKHHISDTVALVDEERSLTYADLENRSNQIANSIHSQGIREGYIGVMMEQSTDFVVAMLGILKAGCAYLPLDISYPDEHLQYAIKSADLSCLIYSSKRDHHSEMGINVIFLDEIKGSSERPTADIDPESPAYLIFTSGSTGKPNGVIVSHQNLITSTQARFDYYNEHPSAFLLLSSFSFDSSVAGIYWTLLNGGKIVIPKKESVQDTEFLTQLIANEAVSHTLLIPSLYQAYLEHIPSKILSNLEVVILAGETLSLPIAEKHLLELPSVKLYNEYGPTEATVWITAFEVTSDFSGSAIPIGRPIGQNTVFILDENQNLTPRGIPGELHVTGKSLTQGYLGNSDSTKEKFTQVTIDGQSYRAYKTGDWVNWDQEGNLLFLGRRDHQVKIRGHRIELGEIDSKIQSIDKEVNPVTVFNESQQLLVTYLVADKEVNTDGLKNDLSAKLPKQYWPDAILQIEAFPFMANGKVNIKELQQRKVESIKKISTIVVKSSTQGLDSNPLLKIWREVLNDDSIGVHDNFFEVGGDSIQLIRIIAKARKHGLNLKAKDIFNNQTINSLSAIVNPKKEKKEVDFDWKYLPTTPIQDWFFDLHQAAPEHWLQGYEIRLKKSLPFKTLESIIQRLVDGNEILHTSFINQHGKWLLKKTRHQVGSFISKVEQWPNSYDNYSLSKSPLLQVYLIEKKQQITALRIVIHHLIVDAVSWQHLLGQLHDLIADTNSEIASPSESFFQWTLQFNLLAQSNLFDKNIPYWESMLDKPSPYFNNVTLGREQNIKTIHRRVPSGVIGNVLSSLRQYSSVKINEAVIALFIQAFSKISGESGLTVMIEGHGRDVDFTEIDLSESIGWFTSYYPLYLQLSNPTDTLQSLIEIKEQLRRVPNKGLSYGALKYQSQKLKGSNHAAVTINHLGDSTQINHQHFSEVNFLKEGMRSPLSERTSLVEVNSYTEQGELLIDFSYDEVQLNAAEIEQICEAIIGQFNALPNVLNQSKSIDTPSDYDFQFSQSDLDRIRVIHGGKPEALLSLTATQSALLFHHLQSPQDDQGLITARVILHGDLDQKRLQDAWAHLVKQHDVLRSYFIWESLDQTAQVIGKSVVSEIAFYDFSNKKEVEMKSSLTSLAKYHLSKARLDQAPIHDLICVKDKSDKHHLIFICHHLFIDGWSTNVLFSDLINAYETKSKGTSHGAKRLPSLSTWKQEVTLAKSNPQLKIFWDDYTSNVQPTVLKPYHRAIKKSFMSQDFILDTEGTSHLLTEVKEQQITLTVFLIGVWSWLLSKYLEEETTSVGMILSGRSLDIDHFDETVGMFSTVLPFIQRHNRTDKIDYNQVQDNFNEVLNRDAVSIEDLIGNDKTQNLYDTLLIVENFMKDRSESTELTYSGFQSKISSLMPLCLIIVPGDQLKITLRYNTDLYQGTEIEQIGNDLIGAIKGITFTDRVASLSATPTYKVGQRDLQQLQNEESTLSIIDSNLPTQDVLQVIWKDVLKLKEIKAVDDFFELGGTSLMAVRIFNQINKQLKINASPILLLKHRTIESLASVLKSSSVDRSWDCLYPLKQETGSTPLFCFHAGEGHILFYNDLAEHTRNRSVYGIQPVGLDGQDIEFSSIEEMANYYISKIKEAYPIGPYHLLGTCFSNAVTFEIAKRLGDEMGELIFVDSPPPYYKEFSKMKKWLSWVITFNIPKLWEAFSSLTKYLPWKVPKDEQERNLFLTGKHMRDIMVEYQWSPQPFNISLIRSSQNNDDKYKQYHINNWQELARKGVNIKVVDGEHLSIFEGKSALEMASIIESLLIKYD